MRRLLLLLPVCLAIGSDRVATRVVHKSLKPVMSRDDRLPTSAEFVELAQTDPTACMLAAVRRYREQYVGFHAVMRKQERIGGRLNPVEIIDVWHRDDPHSVFLNWQGKPAGLAERVLYVDGANDNKMLGRPYGAIARRLAGNMVARDPDGPEAKAGGRVNIREFGLLKAVERHAAGWQQAKQDGRLHVQYQGVQTVEHCDKPCHVFVRTYDPPEGPERFGKIVIGLEAETWLQTSAQLFDADGQLLGSYSFRDLQVNPTFPPGCFDKEQLNK